MDGRKRASCEILFDGIVEQGKKRGYNIPWNVCQRPDWEGQMQQKRGQCYFPEECTFFALPEVSCRP